MSEVVRSEEVQGWREATMANVNEKLGYSVEMTDSMLYSHESGNLQLTDI